jgi:hypothetical protein
MLFDPGDILPVWVVIYSASSSEISGEKGINLGGETGVHAFAISSFAVFRSSVACQSALALSIWVSYITLSTYKGGG